MKLGTEKIQHCALRINMRVQLKADPDKVGMIAGFAPTKIVQRQPRPYLVLFDDEEVGWYSQKALKKEGDKESES